MKHAAREFGVGVPERPRRPKTVDHDQHLLHFRPVPVQRHRIAARGPGIAEADHAADAGEPERGVDDRQREDHVLAGVHRAILSQDDVGRNTACGHCIGNDLAFRPIGSRRHAAAHDRPAKKPFAPQPAGFIDALADIHARAEHEQQVGRPQRRLDQMPRIDRGDLGFRWRSRGWDCHGNSLFIRECRTKCRAQRRFAKSHFVSLDCESRYGSSVSGSASNE